MPAVLIDSLTDAARGRGTSWLDVECVGGGAATVYLLRGLDSRDLLELYRVPNALPPTVHTLRVQLGGSDADSFTMNALRTLVRMWRYRGAVHVVFVGRPDRDTRDASRGADYHAAASDPGSAATTAAYL